jgi:hypothetical protein
MKVLRFELIVHLFITTLASNASRYIDMHIALQDRKGLVVS